jgi:hypothetical protein
VHDRLRYWRSSKSDGSRRSRRLEPRRLRRDGRHKLGPITVVTPDPVRRAAIVPEGQGNKASGIGSRRVRSRLRRAEDVVEPHQNQDDRAESLRAPFFNWIEGIPAQRAAQKRDHTGTTPACDLATSTTCTAAWLSRTRMLKRIPQFRAKGHVTWRDAALGPFLDRETTPRPDHRARRVGTECCPVEKDQRGTRIDARAAKGA